MDDPTGLADRFEAHRPHLRAVAYRMLGSAAEADDAVQESWFRLSRTDASAVDNLGGWLTTVVSRVCLDMLRARTARREELGGREPEPAPQHPRQLDPEEEAVLADSIGSAVLVVLDLLAPAERLAFVLHDMFAVPFDEIGAIVGKTPAAARQLASRARRRVQGARPESNGDLDRQREVVDAFLAASRDGDFEALVALLDPDIVLRADPVTVERAKAAPGAPQLANLIRGRDAVADVFAGRARAAQPALVDGAIGVTWAPGGTPRSVFELVIRDGRIVAIDVVADPDVLGTMDVTPLSRRSS